MFGIKKYFGHRSNNDSSTEEEMDGEITREAPLDLRPGNPITTSFNRKLIISVVGLFALIFTFSMFYGMTDSSTEQKKEEDIIKDKKISTTTQTSNHLDKLPASYGGKNQNSSISTGEKNLSQAPIQEPPNFPRQSMNYTPPRQSYQPVDYNSPPPIPVRPQGVSQLGYDSSEPVVPVVNSAVNKEEQEIAEARKSPIRFTLK